ncbi:MAG TPA: response regulator transcription factor [Burkholderiaceae bacterium]|nr:response regulator transcription factor [Burkholderiaceae bacterium]
MRVLLVEDDRAVAQAVDDALCRAGFVVETLGRAEPADAVLSCTTYDLVLLDVGLPGMNGLALLARLRQRGNTVPVLMLTARDALEDRVRGLNQGADDYLVKPFQLPELVARCQALVRRGRQASGSVLAFGPLQMDTGRREASLGGDIIGLTGREWDLLEQLMLAAPNVVAKSRLIDSLSRWDASITANAVEIYASRLRAKLGGRGVELRTVRGLGYRLETVPDG